ncbi:uncharacterized protein A4U43_C01F13090 [Asparagus officinalis]|uniref:Uncharacterized protein n=1 Tax=Asparagus officinalis TaxID=4686 RepID=A0A5P1FP02_ASPOF|nr:uncharacterized protein A4U43_C01F13090 [Asparagus officinalis]
MKKASYLHLSTIQGNKRGGAEDVGDGAHGLDEEEEETRLVWSAVAAELGSEARDYRWRWPGQRRGAVLVGAHW